MYTLLCGGRRGLLEDLSLSSPVQTQLFQDEPGPLNRFGHRLMRNCELRKDVEIMRKTLIVVELAPHSALP